MAGNPASVRRYAMYLILLLYPVFQGSRQALHIQMRFRCNPPECLACPLNQLSALFTLCRQRKGNFSTKPLPQPKQLMTSEQSGKVGRKIQRKVQKREESVYKRLQNYPREKADRQTKQASKSRDRGAG